MEHDGDGPETLTRAECLQLLATRAMGRIAYSRRALPAIATVAYEVVGDTIVLRLPTRSAELASLRDAVVAFQTDHSGLDHRTGWSVSCVGRAHLVDEPAEVWLLETAAGCAHGAFGFVRLVPDLLEGRAFRELPAAGGTAVTRAAAPSS